MANKELFKTDTVVARPATGETSEGRPAYSLHAEQTLAELACVGTFQNTYYNDAKTQLKTLLTMAAEVSDEYLARVAVYSREQGYMKDMPAALLAVLSTRSPKLFRKVFSRIVDNPRMIRTFVQIMRSGAVGRRSLGNAPKKMIQRAIQNMPGFLLLNSSVGNNPSMSDVIKMVHPRPVDTNNLTKNEMQAAFAWIIGKEYNPEHLPKAFQEYEAFKAGERAEVPRCNFRLIDGLETTTEDHWRQLGYGMNWTTLKMNLNTLARHGALKDSALIQHTIKLLSDKDKVAASRCFPYSIMTGFNYLSEDVPASLRGALQDALELSVDNVPEMPGRVLVSIDISGSMCSLVGDGMGKTQCIDAAGLFGAAILKKNPDAKVTAFSEQLFHRRLNPRDSIATITRQIKGSGFHGATRWDAAIDWALNEREKFDAIIWVSDMEANLDSVRYSSRSFYGYEWGGGSSTNAQQLIAEYRKKVNKNVKIITINMTANGGHAQVDGEFDHNVLQVAGFSDHVFDVIASFMKAKESGHWVKMISAINI